MGLEHGSKVWELRLRQDIVWIPEVGRVNGPAAVEESLLNVDDYD